MTIAGNIYGVVLNDSVERGQLAPHFGEKPYGKAPEAPVVYMKPLASIAQGAVPVPSETGLIASTTLAVLIARDTGAIAAESVATCVGGIALALDLSLPAASYYRPAVAQKNGDGRLALGTFVAPAIPPALSLSADGVVIHEWSLHRLARPVDQLIADLSTFMTLRAGDVLLIGLPGNAPTIYPGAQLLVEGEGLPSLDVPTKGDSR
jgi:5-oxopent-3-ene-1,2,5-tricarboxylate decarboxylase / 2-hydroxyhepta-2,4-diene-1,7-dioate isomerase